MPILFPPGLPFMAALSLIALLKPVKCFHRNIRCISPEAAVYVDNPKGGVGLHYKKAGYDLGVNK